MIGREVLILMRVEAQRTLEACQELTGIRHPKLALGMAARRGLISQDEKRSILLVLERNTIEIMQECASMLDLTIEIMQQCASMDPSRSNGWNIGGYRQTIHPVTYEVECSCKGYQFRHKCKHADEADKTRCHWHQNYSAEVQTEEQEAEMVCPRCGGETMYVKVGV